MPPLIVAAFVFIHGAIHLSFLAPRPPATADGPPWPFTFDQSRVVVRFGVRPGVIRLVGLALTAVTFAALTFAAMSVAGLIPTQLWPPVVALGAGTSIAMLALFFHPWLVLGVVIDVGLLTAAFLVDRSGLVPL